jgi:hypothetical protein
MLKVTERATTLTTLEDVWAAKAFWAAVLVSNSESIEEPLWSTFLDFDSSTNDEVAFEAGSNYKSDDLEYQMISTEFMYTCINNLFYLKKRGSIPKNLYPLSILE